MNRPLLGTLFSDLSPSRALPQLLSAPRGSSPAVIPALCLVRCSFPASIWSHQVTDLCHARKKPLRFSSLSEKPCHLPSQSLTNSFFSKPAGLALPWEPMQP